MGVLTEGGIRPEGSPLGGRSEGSPLGGAPGFPVIRPKEDAEIYGVVVGLVRKYK